MNLETKIIIYKFTPQVFTLTREHKKSPLSPILFADNHNPSCFNLVILIKKYVYIATIQLSFLDKN